MVELELCPNAPPPARAFPPTRWSLVLEARRPDEPKARAALEELCRIYWPPIFAYLRRQGYSQHDAEDFTQGFFANIIEGDTLQKADRNRGRLRTLLLTELRHHLADAERARQTLKRGHGIELLSVEVLAEAGSPDEPTHEDSPDRIFERTWTRGVAERARASVRALYSERGKLAMFEVLGECLAWNGVKVPYRALAEQLKLGESAVRLQVFRLRQKYRELLEAEVAQTVATPDEFREEMAWLIEKLRGAK